MKFNFSVVLLIIFITHFLLSPQSSFAQESKQINFAQHDPKLHPNSAYINELLALILQNTKKKYVLKPSNSHMQQDRVIYEMTRDKGLFDLMFSMTTDEREKKMIPIRIPLDKGLIGWRVALINAKKKDLFINVKNLEQLAQFTAGQQRDWPDVDILRANKLQVATSNLYEPLFKMLTSGRFDYLPRSIFEYDKELKLHQEIDMIVDDNIVLIYPAANYFFVTPRRPELAEDLKNAFEKIVKDGNFEKLFVKYNQIAISQANNQKRVKIHLINPLLTTKNLPLHRHELWYYEPIKNDEKPASTTPIKAK